MSALFIKLDPSLMNRNNNTNKITEREIAIYKLSLYKNKNNIMLNGIAILNLETFNGSLKINSSITGNKNEILKILNEL